MSPNLSGARCKLMHHIFFVEQNYSFSILKPLAVAARERGHKVTWYVLPGRDSHLIQDELVVRDLAEARLVASDTVIAPGNWIPSGLSGLCVQVFHGFGLEKKGHFKIRGYFDLYCTPGPRATAWYQEQAQKHGYFFVAETGWPKLDPYASAETKRTPAGDKVKLLFAPTFSPSLSSSEEMLPILKELSSSEEYEIQVKFHPLENAKVIAAYKEAKHSGLRVATGDDVLELIWRSDILISDTSSVVHEALWMGKPVITVRNSAPTEAVLDVKRAADVPSAILQVRSDFKRHRIEAERATREMHPYRDGLSSIRVLDEIAMHSSAHPKRRKPFNLKGRVSAWRRLRRILKNAKHDN